MDILLAIDASESSNLAVEEVATRRWPKGTRVCVLNVVESAFFGGAPILIESASAAARAFVSQAAERVRSQEVEAVAAVILGRSKVDIAEYAENWGADLIVVGSHGQSGFTRFLLGSVAQSVVRQAHCSVEVVRARSGQAAEGLRILMATDGSPFSLAAARSIAERPWPAGTEVRIISVPEIAFPLVEPGYIDSVMLQALRKGGLEEAQEATQSAAQVISGGGIKTNTATPLGVPKLVILGEAKAWGADLIVVGSHGRHGVERLLTGSVSEAVAVHAPCSVEVIREKVAEGAP